MTSGWAAGKLMLAGEYAVLQPGGLAIAAAVGRLVRWQARLDGAPGIAVTAFGQTVESPWPCPAPPEGLLGFAVRAFAAAEAAVGGVWHGQLHLEVFGDRGGTKLGLGNSAAVTVAALRAWMHHNGLPPNAAQVAELARAAHRQAQGGAGSGYDVTAIACGGLLAYWPQTGEIRQLGWPPDLAAAAFFTGEAAPTRSALARSPAMAAQLPAMALAADRLLAAWPLGGEAIVAALANCEVALQAAEPAPHTILTEAVDATRGFLLRHGLVPRVSGAGGGDCVLGFGSASAVNAACDAWQAQGGLVAARLPADLAPPAPALEDHGNQF